MHTEIKIALFVYVETILMRRKMILYYAKFRFKEKIMRYRK